MITIIVRMSRIA